MDSLSVKVEIKPLEAALYFLVTFFIMFIKKVRCETSLFFVHKFGIPADPAFLVNITTAPPPELQC